jgi:hypothetical protein
MVDMITFNGDSVVTYGLTGLMIALLTTMVFIDTKGQSSAVAMASVPSIVGDYLTPSVPSFIESVTDNISAPSITGNPSTPSVMESITNAPSSVMESITNAPSSVMESITGKSDEQSSVIDRITTPVARLIDEDEGYEQNRGGSRKNKKKNTKKKKNTRKSN